MRALSVSARFSITDEGEEDASEELGRVAARIHNHCGDPVAENRFAVDAQHRLRKLVGEFLHARAFAGGEDDCFHGLDSAR